MAGPSTFKLRKNSPFTLDQQNFIIFKYGELGNVTSVNRAFNTRFFPKNPRKAPKRHQIERVIARFQKSGSVNPPTPLGQDATSQEDVMAVQEFFTRNPRAHLRHAMVELDMSINKIWRILRKFLKFKPYKPHTAQVLSPANMQARLAASNFLLSFTEEQLEKVLWSDEKWFVLHQAPNSKNDVVWGPANTRNVVACKKAHQAKVMAWVGIVDGKVLPVHWFEGNVDSNKYLDMLETIVWPAVRGSATRKQYWFMQDGAPPHCTAEVLEFLASKFGDRVISRKTQHFWPPYSPDLNPLDFSFWSQAMAHVLRCKPATIEDLKSAVDDFALNFDPQKALKMARHVRYRAQLCRSKAGGHFEDLIKHQNSREE